jgi:hypothetical protein
VRRGDTDTARRQPPDIHQIELIGANRFRTELFWQAVKMFCVRDNLLQVGRLGIIGEVADNSLMRNIVMLSPPAIPVTVKSSAFGL